MKYNAKYDRWFSKEGLVYRYDEKTDRLVLCATHKVRGYIKFSGSNGSDCPNPRFVHRAIWETFNGPIPEGMEIDHKHGNRSDNRLSELQCVTHIENMANPHFRQKRQELNTDEYRNKMSLAISNKPKKHSDFGHKYQEHYNLLCKENVNLYMQEYRYYKKCGHCRWEEE